MANFSSPSTPGPGGFIPDLGLLSPSPSQASSVRSHTPGLPHPRRNPLRPGSSKEDLVRRYVESRLLYISRRFVKKYGIAEPDDEVVGYKSMTELGRDVDDLLNVIWLSGTPSLQAPYLLNIAGELVSWVGGFQPAPRVTFSVLQKLDHCFASLLSGADVETGEPLPGFERGLHVGMTRTDMVRCRSTAELTRVVVADVISRASPDPADEAESRRPAMNTRVDPVNNDDDYEQRQTGDEEGAPDFQNDEDEDLHMDVAKVYEMTLVKLGEVLGDGGGRIGEILAKDDVDIDDADDADDDI
ncbi:hypothetical protein CMQ_483 [Grosmannia clavigera kw1407]|uniref:Meiotic recombination protein DMC1 n=1 Tax=Grosmannia clavigera (strain kw1407 / UAMH 11150) TaxID=655863 RepID=F0XDM6_GROCL|nr:uncharacterized protein CMQ_483 [Grosmannia clavigera kw1407]EFX03555.1 hypothetical protein CMQ_483 [Grosmannia clavigera kw1407]